jgi:hypothetical protein
VKAASGRTLDAVIEDALRESFNRRTTAIQIPTFGGRGLHPGVDLDNNAALLELMESDRDSRRRQHPHLRTPRRRG